jgi:hypothetical protein
MSMSDQFVGKDATYTTHKKHKRRTPKPSVGFETTIPAIEKPETYALDFKVTGICLFLICLSINAYDRRE